MLAMPGRSRPRHGKFTAALLGASICLNAILALYCINLRFMEPLAYDRGQELAMLQRKDQQLLAQRAALEKTTKSLIEQKNQLLQHYKETEHVGKKLEAYKDKLKKDAEEVKNAEEAAEILMQRLAKAQGDTVAAQSKLKAEKQKLESAKKELGKVEEQEKQLKRSQKTDRLVRALESDGNNLSSEERAELCHDCTCVRYC